MTGRAKMRGDQEWWPNGVRPGPGGRMRRGAFWCYTLIALCLLAAWMFGWGIFGAGPELADRMTRPPMGTVFSGAVAAVLLYWPRAATRRLQDADCSPAAILWLAIPFVGWLLLALLLLRSGTDGTNRYGHDPRDGPSTILTCFRHGIGQPDWTNYARF